MMMKEQRDLLIALAKDCADSHNNPTIKQLLLVEEYAYKDEMDSIHRAFPGKSAEQVKAFEERMGGGTATDAPTPPTERPAKAESVTRSAAPVGTSGFRNFIENTIRNLLGPEYQKKGKHSFCGFLCDDLGADLAICQMFGTISDDHKVHILDTLMNSKDWDKAFETATKNRIQKLVKEVFESAGRKVG